MNFRLLRETIRTLEILCYFGLFYIMIVLSSKGLNCIDSEGCFKSSCEFSWLKSELKNRFNKDLCLIDLTLLKE